MNSSNVGVKVADLDSNQCLLLLEISQYVKSVQKMQLEAIIKSPTLIYNEYDFQNDRVNIIGNIGLTTRYIMIKVPPATLSPIWSKSHMQTCTN